MAGESAEAILLRLGLDASGFTKGTREARKELGLMEKGVSSLKGHLGSLAATAAAGIGVAALSREAIRFAESVTKVHEQTGLATDAIQFLRLAADQTGTSVESLASLVGKMQRQLVEAGSNDKLAAEFTNIGLSVDALRAQRPEEQLQSIAKAIASLSDPAERSAAAVVAFGKAGADAIPELVALAEKNDELVAAFQRTGGAVGGETIAAVEGLGDAMGQTKTAVVALATELLGTAAPALTSFLQTVTETVAGLRLLDGQGDNAMVNLDSKIRSASMALDTLRVNAANGMIYLNGTPMDEAIAKQEALVAALEDEYNALAGLGVAGAARAKSETEFQSLLAANASDSAAILTASLEQDLAIRAAFGELRFEQDTALEERLFQMREEARQRELDAVMAERQTEVDFLDGLQAGVDANVAAGIEEASGLKIATWQQETNNIAGMIAEQTEGVARQSRAMFEINKAASLAKAAVSLPSAVIESFNNSGGYPWGIPAAVAMAAAGAAQIAAIASTSFGSKTAPSQATQAPVPTAPQGGGGGGQGGGQVMRVEGLTSDSIVSGASAKVLASKLLEWQKDGGEVVFAS